MTVATPATIPWVPTDQGLPTAPAPVVKKPSWCGRCGGRHGGGSARCRLVAVYRSAAFYRERPDYPVTIARPSLAELLDDD